VQDVKKKRFFYFSIEEIWMWLTHMINNDFFHEYYMGCSIMQLKGLILKIINLIYSVSHENNLPY